MHIENIFRILVLKHAQFTWKWDGSFLVSIYRISDSFVWCPTGHCPWSLVVFFVHKWYLNRYWFWNKTVCGWLCLLREIKDTEDTLKLQKDIDQLGCWVRKWGMRFQPVKCNMMQRTRKRIKKIHASHTLEGTVLENVESIKYLGVTITNDLRWNTHVSNICTKANRTLGFLRRNLYSCSQEVKQAAYTGLVRPVLEYISSVWDPSGVGLQNEPEKVQNRAARIVGGNYNFETGSMTGILEHLKWESLKKRRRDSRLILLYKGLKGKASIPTDDLIPLVRRCRNDHTLCIHGNKKINPFSIVWQRHHVPTKSKGIHEMNSESNKQFAFKLQKLFQLIR